MIYPFDFHTHTNLCDGKNSAEDMVKSAIDKGLKAIGFSGHSFTEFDRSYCMSKTNSKIYESVITELKEKYQDKLEIYLGIEKDFYSDYDCSDFDYVIGSVHYVKKGEKYIDVDLSAKDLCDNVDKFYNGDFYAFCKDYYENVAELYNKTKCDIIGHFDLVAKFNENDALFKENEQKYIDLALQTVDKLLKNDVIFEVNTGAISRGYKTNPYPQNFILEHIKKSGGSTILSSDAHSKDNLCFDFDNTLKLIKNIGFKTVKTIKNKKFIDIEI
ncbi:MAG: histidinol-phosphatase [Clostridia bacterium]|nr:histidinol-phosphatase [Clostridia bacterium]